MKNRIITEEMLNDYQEYLEEEEKSIATIQKYIRDVRKLIKYANGKEITKKLMKEFKEKLWKVDQYKISSINSFLVAANRFLEYQGWYDARVKTYKVQRESFRPDSRNLSKEEYICLVQRALKKGKTRLAMMIQTMGATGLRVSELCFLTIEGVKEGMAEIHCKGKIRQVLIPMKLQRQLLKYIKEQGMERGIVFKTSGGRPVDRSNFWREMKALGKDVGINEKKVFPHNLRHLFAQSYYKIEKDIAKLADILGHSSMETTRIYIRITGSEHRKQLEQMKLVYNI